MKKKLLVSIISIVCLLACVFGLVACNGTNIDKPPVPKHEHTYSEEWKSDANNHWHAATCEHTNEKSDVAAHIDENNDGKCDICEYEPMTVKVGGTYYFCEDDITDDLIYIVFKDGGWTDDEYETGEYTLSGNSITLYVLFEGEKEEFASGTVIGDDVTLDMFGAEVVYRKGEDISSKPKEKTLKYALSEDRTYYIVSGIGGLTGDIEIPDEWKKKPVKEIAENAFANCAELTGIVIGNNVETVGEKAFYKCANLKNATLGESVDDILGSTFEECKKLESITIPASVKSIGEHAFYGCIALKDVHYSGTASDWAQIDFYHDIGSFGTDVSNPLSDNNIYIVGNNTASAEHKSRDFYIGGELAAEIEITDAQMISPVAFWGYKGLKSLVIGGSATDIGKYAFSECDELQTLRFIGSDLKTVGERAFNRCGRLSSVVLPDSVIRICEYAFNECEGLTAVNIGNGVGSIGEGAFMGCSALSSLTLGNSLIEICESAFYGCDRLANVNIPSSTEFIGKDAFFGTGLTSATFGNTQGWQIQKGNRFETVDNLDDTANAATLLKNSVLMNPEGYSDYDWETPSNTLTYTLSNDGTYYTVTGTTTKSIATAVIRSKYNGKPVTSIGQSAFYECSKLTGITIPDSVTSIWNSAFEGCSSLTSITVAVDNQNYSSQDGILYNKAKTKFVHVPKAIKGAVTIPEGITSIWGYGNYSYSSSAFGECSSLTSITIPNSVTSIERYAFYGCSSLTSITIPNGVTSIGHYAFYGCSSLTIYCEAASAPSEWDSSWKYDCPVVWDCKNNSKDANGYEYSVIDGIRYSLKDGIAIVVNQPSNIKTANIPNSVTNKNSNYSVTSIEESAFFGCSSLMSITVAADNPNYSSQDGILYNKTKTKFVHVPQAIKGAVTIPEGITSIYQSDFFERYYLTSVEIPNSVTIIESSAFSDYGRLENITVAADNPNYSSQDGILYNKTKTKFVYIPRAIKGAVTIPEGITDIEIRLFANRDNLTSITIPSSVTSIGEYAFACRSLTSIKFNDIASYCGINGLDRLYISKVFIGNQKLTDLTSITIPNGVTRIGNSLFYDCSSLTSVTIPDSVTRIGREAFYGCSSLMSVTIPNSVTSIGDWAFGVCRNLTSVTIPNSVTNIGSSAFYDCSNLTNITFNGTKAQWNAITKMNYWNQYTGNYTVHCTDGDIVKGEDK